MAKAFKAKLTKITPQIKSFTHLNLPTPTIVSPEDLPRKATSLKLISITIPKSSPEKRFPSRLLEEYDIQEKLGQGNQASVYKVQNKNTFEIYAAKVYHIKDTEQIALIEKEVVILKSLSANPNIIKFIDFLREEGPHSSYGLIMELFPSITLEEFIKDHSLTLEQTLSICRKLFEALTFLHFHSVAHRDLNLTNVLIDPETLNIKIIDFGLSKVNADLLSLSSQGNCSYRPPCLEVFQHMYLVDLWHLGLIFLSLFMRRKINTKKTRILMRMEEDNCNEVRRVLQYLNELILAKDLDLFYAKIKEQISRELLCS